MTGASLRQRGQPGCHVSESGKAAAATVAAIAQKIIIGLARIEAEVIVGQGVSESGGTAQVIGMPYGRSGERKSSVLDVRQPSDTDMR